MTEAYKEDQNQSENNQTMGLESPLRKEDEEQAEPENPLAAVTLSDLSPRLQTACAKAGWAGLLPVQSQAIPYLAAGRNLMVQSQAYPAQILCGDVEDFQVRFKMKSGQWKKTE